MIALEYALAKGICGAGERMRGFCESHGLIRRELLHEIRRQDLVTRFGIQSAAASRDLALYKELAPSNIDYDPKGKSYVLGPDFRPSSTFRRKGCCRG